MISEKSKNIINYIILCLSVIFLGLLCLGASPLWLGKQSADSSVFMVMGKGLLDGKVIYKDIFDHKGPIIYIINALGMLINNKYGVCFIEIIFIFISVVFIYKSAKLFFSSPFSLIPCMIYLAFLFIPISAGNLTEDYGCVFSAIGLYYVLKILFKQEEEKKWNWVVIGLTFGLTFFTKPTYIALWVAFAIVEFFRLIIKREIKDFGLALFFSVLGFMIVAIPIVLYFYINNSLADFWNAFLTINIKYSDSTLVEKIANFFTLVKNEFGIVLIIIAIVNICFLFSKKISVSLKIFSLLFFVMTVLFTGMASNPFMHYLIQMATMIGAEFIFIFYFVKNIKRKKYKHKKENVRHLAFYVVAIWLLPFIVCVCYLKGSTVFNDSLIRDENLFEKQMECIKSKIDSTEYECLVIGNSAASYLYLDKYTNFKYFFQYPIAKYDDGIMKETVEYIKNKNPKLVIIKGIGKDETYVNITDDLLKVLNQNYKRYYENWCEFYILKDAVNNVKNLERIYNK